MSQKVGNNSEALIAGHDINIGMTYKDVKDVVYDLFEKNFPKLISEATTKAQDNVEMYLEKMEENLKKRIEEIDLNKFKEPNTQFILNSSIKIAARRGNDIDLSILSEVLISSITNKDSEMLPLVAEQALEILPKLKEDHVKLLSLFQYLMFMRIDKVKYFRQSEEQHIIAYSIIQNIGNNAFNSISYLTSIGVFLYNEFQTIDVYQAVKNNHNNLLKDISITEFKNNIPNTNPTLYKMTKMFKRHKLDKINITPAGSLIALINLRRVFGKIDYSHWIF